MKSSAPEASSDPSELAATPGPPATGDAENSSDGVVRLKSYATRVAAIVFLPLGLYFILRPENYGLTPNSLDPIFYSGYAINFDDIMNVVKDRHYFVSRWSAYYPSYIADLVAGPFVGRLLVRLALAAGILSALWSLGRRQRWTWSQQLLIGTLVLTMPMFVRAFFTDYVEYLIVALGICLVAICVKGTPTIIQGIVAGGLAGSIVVANPMAITAVVLPLACLTFLGTHSWRQRATIAATIIGAAVTVVLGGLLLFRWRYGIPNVYQPSIEFVRADHGRDGWKSPRIDWLWHYTWLYATPIMLLAAGAMAVRRTIRFERFEVAAFVLAGTQYTLQWIDQFVRDGNGLEISYYWSYAYPTFAVAFSLFVGRLTTAASHRVLLVTAIGWIAFLTFGVPDAIRLPGGIGFFLVAGLLLALVIAASTRSRVLAVSGLIFIVGWFQIGAPKYDSSIYFSLNNSPHYDRIFGESGALSESIYREVVWFADQMDRVPNDDRASFVTLGTWGSPISGIYAPHVAGRLATLDPAGGRLSETTVSEIRSGLRPILAVVGPPDSVEDLVKTLPQDLGVRRKILDTTHVSALGYRLVVYEMPDAQRLPFTWPAAVLPRAKGEAVAESVIVRPPETGGIVTYGPYISLPVGRYEVELRYRSAANAEQLAGTFEAVAFGQAPQASTDLRGSGGRPSTVTIPFEVTDADALWEFRTGWSGLGDLTIASIRLSQ